MLITTPALCAEMAVGLLRLQYKCSVEPQEVSVCSSFSSAQVMFTAHSSVHITSPLVPSSSSPVRLLPYLLQNLHKLLFLHHLSSTTMSH